MVATRRLDYLLEADRVEHASLLLVYPIDHRDELVVAMSLAILLALSPLSTILALIHGLGRSLLAIWWGWYPWSTW